MERNFSETLTEIIRISGRTQKAVSRLLDITPQYFNKLLKGKTPSKDLRQTAEFLLNQIKSGEMPDEETLGASRSANRVILSQKSIESATPFVEALEVSLDAFVSACVEQHAKATFELILKRRNEKAKAVNLGKKSTQALADSLRDAQRSQRNPQTDEATHATGSKSRASRQGIHKNE